MPPLEQAIINKHIMEDSNSYFSFGKAIRSCLCFFRCAVLSATGLFFGVCDAAKAGRLLPCLTLMIPFHAVVHWHLFALESSSNTLIDAENTDNAVTIANSKQNWHAYSLYFMITNIVLNAVGYTIIILIYRHSVRTIFNRKIPTIRRDAHGCIIRSPHPAIKSFNTHLLMLRPLEILFRFITAPMRVLPDVIIVGETRCGTTNLCGHIASLSSASSISCYTPFCPWAHPELDHKESFYFVGHYLGLVDPYFYRMAFPLKVR